MNKKIKNISESSINLFVKINDIEQKVEIQPGEELIIDNYETKTIRIFKKKELITIKPINESKTVGNEITEKIKITPLIDDIKKTSIISTDKSKLDIIEGEVNKYVQEGYIKGLWSKDEIAFLKKKYPTKGRKYCSTQLNRKESSVQKKINHLHLKKKKKKK